VIARSEEDLVRAIDQVVVRKGLEELDGLEIMVVPSAGWFGLPGPVDLDVFGVPLRKVSQSLLLGPAFHASSRVCINSDSSSGFIPAPRFVTLAK
jgi:hypothetical protein